jgi:prepilin-type N-terminal cleavage/methylation domain-containing protein
MRLTSNIQQKRRRAAGFTLEEVIVALSIVGVTMSATISGYVNVAKRSDWASRNLAANAAAAQRLEQVQAARWDTAAFPVVDEVNAASFPSVEVALDVPQKDAVPTRAKLRTTVEQISSEPPLKMVRVECLWTSLDGRAFTNTLTTYRSPNQ